MARILMVVRPSKGGAFGHAVRLGESLAERGHEVGICGPHGSHRGRLGDLLLELDIPREVSPNGQAKAVRGLVRIERSFRPDLVHAHGSQGGGIARLAKPASPRIPVVFSPHNFAFTNYFTSARQRTAYRAIERSLAPLTSRFIAVCENELREVEGIGAGRRGRLVYNGITPFDPPAPAITSDAPILLAVTELQPPKGVPTLIDAMPLILAKRPDARLLVAGGGPLQAEIEAQVAASGAADSIDLLGDVRNVPALLASADVFVAPGWAESFPYANLEAMSARLPIVAADVGGVGEAVEDGVTGRLVPTHDAAALAAATLDLLADSAEARRLGLAARARLEERFTLEGMIDGTLAVYEELGVG